MSADVGYIIGMCGLGVAIVGGYIKLRERLVALEVKVGLWWDAVSKDAARILHTPHPENKRRDELLEKFVEATISRDELKELIDVLIDIIDNKNREFGERTAASALLRSIEVQYKV